MVIELRQAAKEKAFDLLEEIKSLGHEKKMALCELEETLYECFESSEEDDEEYENEDVDMEYRKRAPYRYGRSRDWASRPHLAIVYGECQRDLCHNHQCC